MAITDESSVLILGAGVSVPFRMPLGDALMDMLSKQIKTENKILKKAASSSFGRNYGDYLRSAVNENNNCLKVPIHAAIFANYNMSFVDQNKKLDTVLALLEGQTSETIDDFIVENPTHAGLTKVAIAAVFMKSCYSSSSDDYGTDNIFINSYSDRRLQQSNGEQKRNWVHLLINIARQGIRSGDVTPENPLQIITFNYDMILEYILEQQFANSENMNGMDWKDYFTIMHPHGKCQPFSPRITCAAKTINSWAEGIHVVLEASDKIASEVQIDRANAKKAILNAREIYGVGFSFSGPNCRLIGLDETTHHSKMLDVNMRPNGKGFGRVIEFCNYDGNIGLSKNVKKLEYSKNEYYGSTKVIEYMGTPDKPLGVSDWIKLGVLGELPA